MERKLPPLRALLALEAFARRGGRAEAASELNVTPGAIGKGIRKLEDWTGVPLVRDGVLTPAGRTLATSVCGGLDQVFAGAAALRPSPHAPEVNLLAPATLALRWLIPHLPELTRTTGLSIAVRPTHTGEDWSAMPHDVVVRRDGWIPPGYRAEPLGPRP